MASFTTKEMEASKLYECTFLQFEKQSLWTQIYYYDMLLFLNPYDSEALRKRVEMLKKIVEINKEMEE